MPEEKEKDVEEKAADTKPIVYDFTKDPADMNPVTRGIYFQLRYLAITDGDPKALPNGKKISAEEVAKMLGPELAAATGLPAVDSPG